MISRNKPGPGSQELASISVCGISVISLTDDTLVVCQGMEQGDHTASVGNCLLEEYDFGAHVLLQLRKMSLFLLFEVFVVFCQREKEDDGAHRLGKHGQQLWIET